MLGSAEPLVSLKVATLRPQPSGLSSFEKAEDAFVGEGSQPFAREACQELTESLPMRLMILTGKDALYRRK